MKLFWLRFIFLVSTLSLSACVSARKSLHLDSKLLKDLRPLTMNASSWKVVFDGGGRVENSPAGGLVLEPSMADHSQKTHAALVLSTLPEGARDFIILVEYTNRRQLRKDQANDWEVFWLLTNYRLAENQKKTANYLILKPQSGVELGKIYNEVGQEFLFTSARSPWPLGRRAQLVVEKRGQRLRAWLNSRLIVDYKGNEKAPLYDHPGDWGLYTEDAEVEIHSFAYKLL